MANKLWKECMISVEIRDIWVLKTWDIIFYPSNWQKLKQLFTIHYQRGRVKMNILIHIGITFWREIQKTNNIVLILDKPVGKKDM